MATKACSFIVVSSLLIASLTITAMRAFAEPAPSLPFSLQVKLTPNDLSTRFKWDAQASISREDARTRMRERRDQLEALLHPGPDPYRGPAPLPSLCRPESLPKPVRKESPSEDVEMMSLHSSKAQVVGLCANASDLLKTQYLMLYCARERALYTIRYFYETREPWIKEPVARCKDL